ncbi:MAG: leucine-rich repeat protein, partial [Dysgonomonas sp.]|nr:leucine-rich repeat protein [Dysgonomonas sp.]
MKNRFLLTLLAAILSITYSMAQLSKTVHVSTPGTLSSLLGNDINRVSDLTLTGSINSTDFSILKSMSVLKNLDLKQVTLPNNTLPSNAFSHKKLEKIVLPNTLEIIEQSAFYESNITSIDFSNCTNLHTIKTMAFAGMIGEGTLDFSKNSKLINFDQVLFGSVIKTVILPENMK